MPSSDLPGIVRLRDQREALTLRTVLTTARRLFAERGYARTSVRLLAAEAGVAPQTVYARFGSKAGVLAGLVDLLDEEAGIPDLIAEAEDVHDPMDVLATLARVNRRVWERCGDLVTILRSGAAVDAEIAAAQAEGQRRNRLGVEMAVERIRGSGHGVVPGAADIAVALMSAGVHDSLVGEARWSYDDYETWLAGTLVSALLDERPTTPGSRLARSAANGPLSRRDRGG